MDLVFTPILLDAATPFWYKWWFISLAVLLLAGFIFGFYRTRIAMVEKQKRILERTVRRRTREVEEQKEILEKQKDKLEAQLKKEEDLLLNILPRHAAKEIIETGRVAPKHYRLASVMFADFKNFTKITENLRAAELVAELDDSFAHFDDIVDEFNIEKIKTSGDAYMCVGGIPERNRTNPVDCVLAGMKFIKYIKEKKEIAKKAGKPEWDLRVGIHTGKLVAGVIGKKKFLYDVWGDTVNIASRMEGKSQAGRINVSGATYAQIKDYFECEYRGKVPIKNKGDIDMYYVNRLKPMYSADEEGFECNKLLYSHLNFNVYSDISYRKVRQYMINRLRNELPDNLYYHGVHHTIDVINAAERIARGEGVENEEKMLIKLAALFHDSGFLRKYRNNEPHGAELAGEILPKYGFTAKQTRKVQGMILATEVPQKPTNIMEEILCDADLDYLGRSKQEFYNISNSLKQELVEYGFLAKEEDWDPIQVKFLTEHRYFTQTAVKRRRKNKIDRLNEIKEQIAQRQGDSKGKGDEASSK